MSVPDTAQKAALVAELAAHRIAAARAAHDLRERLRPARIAGGASDRLRDAATLQARRLERRAAETLRSVAAGLDRRLPARGGEAIAIAGAAFSAWTAIQAWRRGRAAVRRPRDAGGSRALAWGALAAACGVVVGWRGARARSAPR